MVLLLLLGSWAPAVGRAAETGGVEAGGAGVGGPVRAAHAMVAAANPLAAAAGLAALRDGGSAVDAAVAAQLVLGVVEPQASGLWGGGLMVLWDARARRLEGLDGLAAAPAAVPARLDRDDGGAVIPRATLDHSGRAVAVPGVMPMLAAAERAHGRLPWSRLARDAIRLAEDGFPLPPHLHAVLLRQPGLAHVPAFARFFDAAGAPLPVGTVLRDPEQARTLRLLAQEGPDALRAGEVAGAVVAAVHAGPLPGGVTAADLAGYRPRERAPVCVDAFGRRVCAAAPPSAGGVAVLQELVMLERAGIARAAPGSVAAVHLILQAGRLAAADRRRWLGDPDQVAVRTRGLLDPAYLRERAALIHPGAADADVRAGDPPADGRQGALPPSSEALAQPATSHVAVVDRDGNAASFTTTVNLDFGAWRLAGGAVLNNAMTNFASGGASGGAARAQRHGARAPADHHHGANRGAGGGRGAAAGGGGRGRGAHHRRGGGNAAGRAGLGPGPARGDRAAAGGRAEPRRGAGARHRRGGAAAGPGGAGRPSGAGRHGRGGAGGGAPPGWRAARLGRPAPGRHRAGGLSRGPCGGPAWSASGAVPGSRRGGSQAE